MLERRIKFTAFGSNGLNILKFRLWLFVAMKSAFIVLQTGPFTMNVITGGFLRKWKCISGS